MAEENVFHGSAPAIASADIDDVERAVGQRLPEAFRQHYLRFNGGAPTHTEVPGDAVWEPADVAMFFPVKHALPGQDATSELRLHFQALQTRKVIPEFFLPFAWDPGGNLFGLDLRDGAVQFISA